MAEVATAQKSLLTSKWGPMPVWAWALIGLAAAWLYSKYKTSQSGASTTPTSGAGTDQSQAVAPQFVIENNEPDINIPSSGSTTPSAPVTTPPPTPPTTTPPGTGSKPPVVGGANPPSRPTGVTTPPAKKPPVQYKVQAGDTLSSIAARYHTSWEQLWAYNTQSGNRPASTIATLKSRGPNLLYRGETILIPQS